MRPLDLTAVLTAVLAGPALAAPAGAADAVYGGHLGTGGDPVVLTTDRAGQRLKGTVIAFSAPCVGGDPTPRVFHKSVAVIPARRGVTRVGAWEMTRNAGGRFVGTYSLPLDVGARRLLLAMKLSGRLTRGTASGTLTATWTLTNVPPDGTVLETCTTGGRRLKAVHRPGFVYGGRTALGEPLVLRLSRDRRNVDDVDLGWHADCSGDQWVDIPEAFTDFPISSTGRFGETFTQRYRSSSGSGDNVFDYTLAGKVGRTSASGTFRAAVHYPDGVRCDTGTRRWKAAST